MNMQSSFLRHPLFQSLSYICLITDVEIGNVLHAKSLPLLKGCNMVH